MKKNELKKMLFVRRSFPPEDELRKFRRSQWEILRSLKEYQVFFLP